MQDQRLKQWLTEFNRICQDLSVRRAADREAELSCLYAEPCPAHAACARAVLADVVISHFPWVDADPAAVAEAVLNRVLALLG